MQAKLRRKTIRVNHMTDSTLHTSARSVRIGQAVWDPFVRFFHWSLVTLITVAAVTGFVLGPSWIPVHILTASLAALLVIGRIIWGFVGGRYARFSGFVAGPVRTVAYARDLLRGREPHYIGHNPLGAAMVLVLMALVLALGVTGWAFLGAGAKQGPFALALPYADSFALLDWHEALAIALVALVVLHVAGVVFTGKREDENLVRAMVTGEKAVGPGDIVPPERAPRLRAALIGGAVTLAAMAVAWLLPLVMPVPGAPVARIDPTTRAECTDCHMLYHPSLLPADDWRTLMATLDDHYGEDASLDPETTAQIRDWLVAHAAGTADTRASKVFRLDPAAGITRLTDTPFWKDRHGGIPDAAFKSPEVGSRGNCAACHKDAERGWFSPFQAEVEG